MSCDITMMYFPGVFSIGPMFIFFFSELKGTPEHLSKTYQATDENEGMSFLTTLTLN